ncbi:MAG TPA: hypothetical protein VJU54_11085, partial [Nitrospiraceae bacterium]|nr:hypothetical protein [Nitrospiraceae bacterium]
LGPPRSRLLEPSRMLKKSSSGVLASLKDSTYRSVRLASSLAAALLDGLFEHPARKRRQCLISYVEKYTFPD